MGSCNDGDDHRPKSLKLVPHLMFLDSRFLLPLNAKFQ
jgi:hypothetical protein